MSKITEKDLEQLSDDLYDLIWMPNKADANPLAARIRYRAHNFTYEDFKEREALFTAITHAESAAGDARRKEYWIRQFETVWVPLETRLMECVAVSRARVVKELEV